MQTGGEHDFETFNVDRQERFDEWKRLNPLEAIVDPSVDTPADAPFAAGQRRNVGDADTAYEHLYYPSGIAMPGDLDGDGLGDIVIWEFDPDSVPETPDADETGISPALGRALIHVIYGDPELGENLLAPDATFTSPYVDTLRSAVSSTSKSGSRGSDLLVGVGTGGCWQGHVYSIPGGKRYAGHSDIRDVGALIRETTDCTGFGLVSGLGDIDGDGYEDFAIGAPEATNAEDEAAMGRVYLYYGAEVVGDRRSEADAAGYFFNASAPWGSAHAAGDVNGDGLMDFVLGSEVRSLHETWSVSRRDEAWLVLGQRVPFEGAIDVTTVGTRLPGKGAIGLGDLDEDTFSELGMLLQDEQAVGAGIFAGRDDWQNADPARDLTWVESPQTSRQNPTLLAAGDANGDGLLDVLYADPTYGTEADCEGVGAVYLLPGPFDLTRTELSLDEGIAFLGQRWRPEHDLEDNCEERRDHVGVLLAAGSDVNGDGMDDFLLTAPGGLRQGVTHLWLGRPTQ